MAIRPIIKETLTRVPLWPFGQKQGKEIWGMSMVLTRYRVKIGLEKKIRIALVSDLHDRDPGEALFMLRRIHPDLILAAGDLMERHEKGMSPWTVEEMDAWQGISRRKTWFTRLIKALDGSLPSDRPQKKAWDERNGYAFLREASRIAPVVMGVGNHEWYFTEKDRSVMEHYGVRLLDNADCELEIRGQRLRIGGLSTRYDMGWLKAFSMKQGKKILICHHPDYYIRKIRGHLWDRFDLVVSGHTHGGQWRLFGAGGRKRGISVFAPGQGIFPKYAYGRYGKLIVSSGVSNTTKIPRFGNPCEIVLIEAG